VFERRDVSAVSDGECYQAGLRFQNVSRLNAQADLYSSFPTPIAYLMPGFQTQERFYLFNLSDPSGQYKYHILSLKEFLHFATRCIYAVLRMVLAIKVNYFPKDYVPLCLYNVYRYFSVGCELKSCT
jgi:hypothetical protein